MVAKRRATPVPGSTWQWSQVYTNAGVPSGPPTITPPRVAKTQEALLVSSGHPGFSSLGKKHRPYKGKHPKVHLTSSGSVSADIGGPFTVSKITPIPGYVGYFDRKPINPPVGYTICKGVSCASVATMSSTPGTFINPSSNAQLDAMGTNAIAAVLPTNPSVNMGQFLYELKDLPRVFDPQMWKDAIQNMRRSPSIRKSIRGGRFVAAQGSSEYLNYQFGWVPLISDMISFFSTTVTLQSKIKQYERDSGRNIRRRRKILTETNTVSSPTQTGQVPYPAPGTLVQLGTLFTDVTTTRDVWFSGCFTYYLPVLDGSISSFYTKYAEYARRFYGLSLDLDTVWRITPWSWALDWFGNTGSVIRNWNAFSNQNLVMRYGYVMETKTSLTKYNLVGCKLATRDLGPIIDGVLSVTKTRRAATPYGFGLNPASFSPFQNSIIAALGINRVAGWK